MSENLERIKAVAKVAVIPVLGAICVQNVRQRAYLRHVSYWEASQSIYIDLVKGPSEKSIRFAGRIIHGATKQEILDIEIDDMGQSEDDVVQLENAFATGEQQPD